VLATPKAYSFPRFSPDGNRIAVSIGSATSVDVWLYDIASKTPMRLTTDGARNDRAEWTPDGKRVLYSSVGRRDLTALWIRNADLSGEPELLEGRKDEQVLEGLVSPDGSMLLFRSTSRDHPHDLWYRKLTGDTTRKALVSLPSTEYAPRFSPNGKWVAYTSNQDGPAQVYVQPFPPTGARYPISDAGGATPIWSPDGRRIYYVTTGKIVGATLQTSPVFTVLRRDSIMSVLPYNLNTPVHAPFDIAPDGKHFLALRPLRNDNGLVIVHNWKSELRKLSRGRSAQ
jgi:serine/threonine-protein kinase